MIHLTYSMEESHQVHLNPVIESLLSLEGINLWRIYRHNVGKEGWNEGSNRPNQKLLTMLQQCIPLMK